MASKLTKFVKKGHMDMWMAFKEGIKCNTGYRYYDIPEGLAYRYPAPGSCALTEDDHPNLYENDWKLPYRNSIHNIRPIEQTYFDDDPRTASNYISHFPTFNVDHPTRGHYDQLMLNETQPKVQHQVSYEGLDINGKEAKEMLWDGFNEAQSYMAETRQNYAPGQHDYDDDYNQINIQHRARDLTGMANDPRIKEMFVETEFYIEEVIGKHQIQEGKVNVYKGTTKKWQILDEDFFDRDQIEKMQAAAQAPMPGQLDRWEEEGKGVINTPFTNANVSKWRDRTVAADMPEFDPQLLGYDREKNRQLFLERYQKPKELTE